MALAKGTTPPPTEEKSFDLIAFGYSLGALVVITCGMSAECIAALSCEFLPSQLSIPLGICFNLLLIIPGLAFGVIGTPFSWFDLAVRGAFDSFGGDGPIHFFLGVADFIWAQGLQHIIISAVLTPFFGFGLFYFAAYLYLNLGHPILPEELDPVGEKKEGEAWVYINGIATTAEVNLANSKLLAKMFGRQIIPLYNPASGMIIDLIECVVWKTGTGNLPPTSRVKLIEVLEREINNPSNTKVVLVSHSQGTIITGNTIEDLYAKNDKLFREAMKEKLEVYNFANCAHVMSEDKVAYLENISNGRDWVAWLGHRFPFPEFWKNDKLEPMDITGKGVWEPLHWGHLLNSHYLYPMLGSANKLKRKYSETKLWEYYDEVHS